MREERMYVHITQISRLELLLCVFLKTEKNMKNTISFFCQVKKVPSIHPTSVKGYGSFSLSVDAAKKGFSHTFSYAYS